MNGMCIALEDSHLEEKYPEFRLLMQEYRDGILLFNLTDESVWSMAVKDTSGLETFYEENNDKYMWGERLEADLIILNDPASEGKIKEMVNAAVAEGLSLQEAGLDTLEGVFIESGIYAMNDNTYIDQIEWVTGQSETKLLTEFNDLYDGRLHNENSVVFALIKEIRKPEPKTLDEARGLVTSDYQNYLEEEWIRSLKEKYTLKVNEEVLEDIQ